MASGGQARTYVQFRQRPGGRSRRILPKSGGWRLEWVRQSYVFEFFGLRREELRAVFFKPRRLVSRAIIPIATMHGGKGVVGRLYPMLQ
jgi:hypothetical protein